MTVVDAPADACVVLRAVRWETYEALLADHEDSRSPRFTYDRGVLEIMRPGSLHETLADLVRALVFAIAEARQVDVAGQGSTTFRDSGWDRGFEPDACFYFRDAALIRGLDKILPRLHPAPEVLFEVDITRSSIDKFALYAQFGVSEVWRHDGREVAIYLLDEGAYRHSEESRAVPGLDARTVTRLLAEGRTTPMFRWLPRIREWARTTS